MNPQQVYDSTPSWNDMWEYLAYIKSIAKGNILEIGTRRGVSTSAFLLGVEKNGGHVYSVDIDNTCANLYPEHRQWTFIHADSASFYYVTACLPLFELDVLLIDGSHVHPHVDYDFRYAALVKKGGLILVHDILVKEPPTAEMIACGYATKDVREAYDEYILKHGCAHEEKPGLFGLGVIVKGDD